MMTVPSFKNLKELEIYLNKQLMIAMDRVGEIALKEMKRYVKLEFEKTKPEIYQRTYEFLDSIVRTKAILVYGAVVVSVEYNVLGSSNIIITNSETNNRIYPQLVRETPLVGEQNWNWHADFWGDDVSDLIPLWKEYGTDNPYYSHDGIGGIIHMEQWVKDNLKRLLSLELNRMGIKTK